MTIQQDHGIWGEQEAKLFLQAAGMEILERNWRYKRAEIDLIAKEGQILVFIEVKTRSDHFFGPPELKVDGHKKKLLTDAAMAYMRSIGHEWEIRFDIISVTGKPGAEPRISHFRDAFFPGMEGIS